MKICCTAFPNRSMVHGPRRKMSAVPYVLRVEAHTYQVISDLWAAADITHTVGEALKHWPPPWRKAPKPVRARIFAHLVQTCRRGRPGRQSQNGEFWHEC